MGKKAKNEPEALPTAIANKDTLQRLNFLYQASTHLATVAAASEATPDGPTQPSSLTMLSRTYSKSIKVIGRKTLVRMYVFFFSMDRVFELKSHHSDPTVKRTLCKGCNIVLLAGNTATVRIKRRSGILLYTLISHFSSSFPQSSTHGHLYLFDVPDIPLPSSTSNQNSRASPEWTKLHLSASETHSNSEGATRYLLTAQRPGTCRPPREQDID